MMPGIDGFTVCKKLREKSSTLGIIMLTAKAQEMDKVSGLMMGADDYITKPFGMMEFIARVKAVLRRSSRHGDDRELCCEDIRIFPGRHQVYAGEESVELTRKEFELLLYLMENKGIALSREKILNNVWNYDYFGDARTIDTHVKKLRNKLGACGSYIKTVWGMGYKFEVV